VDKRGLGIAGIVCVMLLTLGAGTLRGQKGKSEMEYVRDREGKRPNARVAIDNVCAWPNLTVLRDGTIVATVHNQASHLLKPADVDCWASEDGGRTWAKRGTPAPRDTKNAARGHVAAGVAKNGDLIVITTGWSLTGGKGPQGRGVIVPTWVSRSSDGGITWKIDRDSFPAGPNGNPVVPSTYAEHEGCSTGIEAPIVEAGEVFPFAQGKDVGGAVVDVPELNR
jgi:hypothetical protein